MPMAHSIDNNPGSAAHAAAEVVSAVTTVLEALKGEGDALPINELLELLSDYAWLGVTDGPDQVLGYLHDISVAVELLKGSLITPSGDPLVSRDTVELIDRITNAAHARYNLDEGEAVTIEWLAALARVSERTIRSATNSKSPNAMPITKDGHWTFIEAPHALEWLSGRSDFKPTQIADHRPRTATLANSMHMHETWKKWRESQNISIDELSREMEWSQDQTSSYRLFEAGSTGQVALSLAPAFWRKLAARFDSAESSDVAALTYRRLAAAYGEWRIAQPD